MSERPLGPAPSRLVAVLGPTNTGKTHFAVERMLGHASGMIGLPLRLLAREIYDRIVRARGARAVALITGEEKIIPPRASYFVCTVEAMPLSREVEFLAVDEIQLCADPERGHVFTHRLLHARGRSETLLLGSLSIAPLIRRLLPDAEIVSRERFSTLSYAGGKKLTRLPRRSAVVAFSADQVYAIAELIRRQRGGAAVVMGSLSPRTRNAQVELYQSGEVDFLVATDAIGMGLNMDVDHVAFAGLHKFDGRKTRPLHPQEVGQIAGRAGRYRKDGTFGVTGDCEEMDPGLVAQVEAHRYDPVPAAEWRNPRLDFGSLGGLLRSLGEAPGREGLSLSAEALDEITLRQLAADPRVADRCRDRSALLHLWDVCQTPDFRKTGVEEHLRLAREFFFWLSSHGRRIPEDWMTEQFRRLDRTEGEIDALQARLSNVRTLAYVANRPGWLSDPAGWQGRTRVLEERLSDTLHEKLTARFVDRRTSVLMRTLRSSGEILAGVSRDGVVTVEGQVVGRLTGVVFTPERAGSALEEKALRAAANSAAAPEIARRLGRLAAEPDEAFALEPGGRILWRGEAAAAVQGGGLFAPRARLFGDLGPAPVRERALRRIEAWLTAEAGRRLAPLARLDEALRTDRLRGLARGLAWRLVEAGGLLDRAEVREEAAALSPAERRSLRSLGVRLGAFSVFLPDLPSPEALDLVRAVLAPGLPSPRPGRLAHGQDAAPKPVLAAAGLRLAGDLLVAASRLEALDAALRAAPSTPRGVEVAPALAQVLDGPIEQLFTVLRALGFAPLEKPRNDAPVLWRRRKAPTPRPQAPISDASPFSALAALRPPEGKPARARRPARGRRSRRPGRVAG
ncbi:helicase-related protein [Phenylobacterium sp.]|uniref:helicase-related protein n=1 Tax=Phenylobacterium sp. TaxID=1871053 RepID=UPI0025CF6025|nr:helicase-related protein [Phenylobacterium sp.]MCA6286040.1 phosphonate-binding protein [Phenylobacterium sp.]MCA6287745.1 phosphonate-binding protein [Phenylobacterium sp.]MCA6311255.1 phosphonate-binding protein [Phenylobacterium sp.]MCA6323405.1 phosphonate-binding protein [Phenylobacterium sp.]MCA6337588.1 phosphonate-binding protein [Phenylobacterium sp.]